MKIKTILKQFNLREVEINLYLHLFNHGRMTASELADEANISRTASYGLLSKLIAVGLVTETMHAGVKMFSVDPPEKIDLLLQEKEDALINAKQEMVEFKKAFQEQRKIKKPALQMFEGQKEIQQMMKDVLLYRDIEMFIFWPDEEVVQMLGKDFLEKYHEERIARGIGIRVLRPQSEVEKIEKYKFLGVEERQLREAKVAPAVMDFKFGYAVYKDTVRFISLTTEHFGFLVESHELAALMKAQFLYIWERSEKI